MTGRNDAYRVTLVLVDDHLVFREGLRALLAGEPNLQVVGEAGDGLEAIQLAEHNLGVQMANRMAYNTSGVTGSLVPCAGTTPASLTLRASKAGLVPVTGVAFGTNREVYGGQNISYVQFSANRSLTFNLPTCP